MSEVIYVSAMSKNVIARNVIPAKAGTHDNRSNLLFYLFPLLFLLSTSCTTPSTSPEGLSIPIPSRWSQDLNAQATPWLAAQLRVYELPTQTKVHATTMQVDETTGTVKAKSFKLPGGKTYKFIIEFQYLSQGSAIAFAYAEVEKEIGDGNAETVSFTSSDIRYEVDKQDPSISASISQGILPDLDPDNDGWSTYQELKDKVSPTDKTSVPQPPTLKITTTQQGTDLLITLEGEDNAHVEEMKLTDPICGVTKLSEVTGSANGKVTKQIVYRLDLLSVNKDLSSRQLLATVEDGVTAIQGKDEKASLTLDSNLSHPTFAFSDPEEGTELEGTQTLKGIACARQGVQGVTLKYNGEVLAGDTTEKNENILWEMETTFNQLNTELLPDGVVQLEVEVVDKASNSGLGKGQYSVVNTSAIKVVSPKGRKWIFGNEEIEFNVVNQPQVSLVSIKGPIGKLKPIAKNPASASSTLGVSGMEEGEPVTVTVVTEQVDGKPGPSRPVTFKVRNKPNIKIFKSGDLWNGWEGSLQYEVENVNPTTLMIDDQTIITDSEKQCSVNENITTCKGSFKVKPQVSTKYTLKASRLATTEEKCDKQCDVAQDFTPTIMAFDGDVPRYGVDTT
ncbi:MAG: hypothetical protein HYU97_07240, partial [Deltaproteobacteria bacterium]|nr:hypothetical protein [Deltaproteobacteria bacterium]